MGRWGLVFLICILAARSANAADAGLQSLSQELIAIRGTHGVNAKRDAGPELTPIKNALRAWIEPQLPTPPDNFDPDKQAAQLADRLTASLKAAGLTCDGGSPSKKRCEDRDGDLDARGYLGGVSFSYPEYNRYLALKTNVGVECGFDESAYVYEWRDKAWHLVLLTEQDRYGENDYAPQNFLGIKMSQDTVNRKSSNTPLVLTLGFSPWCQSNWQSLYTRLWRVSPATASPKPLIDTADTLYMGNDPTVADGRIEDNDVLIEFEGGSIDGDVLVRPNIRHYLVEGNSIRRIAPVAVYPSQFVDEWLSESWAEATTWIDATADRVSLRKWYNAYHSGDGFVFGEFDDKGPLRCRSDAEFWQVGFTRQAGPKNPELSAYFLVRWMAPYRFTLVKVQKGKFPGCDLVDKMPDNVGTLFPF